MDKHRVVRPAIPVPASRPKTVSRGAARHAGRRIALALAAAAFAAGAPAEPARYELDPAHTTVAFLVAHIGYAKVLGRFLEVTGSYSFDETNGELSEVVVNVNTASVTTDDEDRDQHLRSDDFLDSDGFPEMTFTADGARRTGPRTFEIDGRLELAGQSRPLTLAATWNKSDDYPMGREEYVMGVSARATLERSAFGIDYALDNGWVGDEVEILIELEARRR